ncbi:MAG TPA: response regulator [Tepidisphaeraceae bacterium]|jgi:ActR/RegA family two-component response regulator
MPTPNPPNPTAGFAVLYVDDEEQALKYFRKAMEKEFEVFTAPGVDQAMAILEEHNERIAVVISDQRMPGRTGVELLTDIRKRWPGMVRILLTAYADIESAIAAVNSGAIFKYLNKPADLDLLRKTIHEALGVFRGQTERETLVRERLSELHRLIVADRVKSVAAMADGISHHLRNSMTAMTCFLEESGSEQGAAAAATVAPPGDGESGYMSELWRLARAERESLLQIVQRVAEAAHAPECRPEQETALEPLLWRAVSDAASDIGGDRTVLDLSAPLPAVKADVESIVKLVSTLVRHVARRCNPGGKVRITAEPGVRFWNTAAVRLMIAGQGAAWAERDVASLFTPFAFPSSDPSELGLELLLGFFIAYQHGGDVAVRPEPPDGPGFEVLLPLDPSQVRRPQVPGSTPAAPAASVPVR